MTPHILVAGGGVAGLTTALALHAAGFPHVTVVEAAREIQPVGAGLNIMPNAVRELDALGLLDDLEADAVRTRELRYYHRSGGLISREPRGLRAGYHWPQLSIHRGRLQQVLADAVRRRLGPSAIVTGVRVTGFEQLPDGRPRVRLEHREGAMGGRASLEPDVLIGADGIRSAVRAALNPREGEPPWNGMLVWRGVSWMDARRAGTFMLIAGDDRQKAVVYPMAERPSGDVLVNWALAMPADSIAGPAARGDWNRAVPVSDFLRHYEGWEFDGVSVPEVLRAADAAYEYPMVDREPLLRWSHGRTTLVGDAAHAMYPIGSNGATQSIVDARALAHAMFLHPGDPAGALAAYEAERRPAMTELQRANRRLGPEVVINLAHERAPGGFTHIDDVIPAHERREIAARYAATGAFDPETVNAGSPYEVPVSVT
ncbi:flavin-dependent oxidoreductase [Streptomyces sp. CB03238]|uniref:flavin-dependent oxidoreductase n=1 Tax=Streptomyces sp. CB03238 TaxID=1907777 RepID=UPI000A0F8CD9|nr:flavin-dependent oxidoreductase [Streptomyces sp. CB03238]ORT55446.1 flavin-dependent oxidoreductase [Streptomyces sp. CB03238]